jgi:UDP-N-acetyl-D-mannosaminuronate dehydrogenase
LIIGVAYKRNTDDVRESPALEIIQLLKQEGAQVSFSDPFVAALQANGTRLESLLLSEESLRDADCVLVVTDHSSVDYEFIARHSNVVLDTRNAMKSIRSKNIVRI